MSLTAALLRILALTIAACLAVLPGWLMAGRWPPVWLFWAAATLVNVYDRYFIQPSVYDDQEGS